MGAKDGRAPAHLSAPRTLAPPNQRLSAPPGPSLQPQAAGTGPTDTDQTAAHATGLYYPIHKLIMHIGTRTLTRVHTTSVTAPEIVGSHGATRWPHARRIPLRAGPLYLLFAPSPHLIECLTAYGLNSEEANLGFI